MAAGFGPSDPLRLAGATHLLPRAKRAADSCGVTRLAELTHLDRMGLPVWQAVRPMSRALSVHQGKGAIDADAQVGALLEAIESHHAESLARTGPSCRFDALSPAARAPDLADFARNRSAPPPADADHDWVEASDCLSGAPIYLPFDCVSLDFTRNVPSRFDRASNGMAVGSSREEAIAVALQELIERDAVTVWRAGGLLACTSDGLRKESVPFGWFHEWCARAEQAGASLRFYYVRSLTGTPVFVCEINDFVKEGAPYRATHGSGCHPDPEFALFKALAEALQSRVTFVAGAREDVPPSGYAPLRSGAVVAFGLPLPASMDGVEWNAIAPGPAGADGVAGALERAGYVRAAIVDLGTIEGLHVVKAFVPGLGANERRRRNPRP
ncbi:MAG: YcaO-like family protein [Allosphingosinicella sp.]